MHTYYICSYGGCGSKMLMNALQKYGNVYHIHSRNPPVKLEYIGNENGGNSYEEWFNGVRIPENEINDYTVIYIYRNPCNAILSRFLIPEHLEHIQSNKKITITDVINSNQDLYNINEFYNNYIQNNNRNYKIYCLKYEDVFDKQDELSNLLNIGKLDIIKKETVKQDEELYINKLTEIYKELIDKMNRNEFITISK